jgi:predicted DNA-binding transcriptional regulator AlpA
MQHSLLTIAQTADRINMSPTTVIHWAYRRRPAPAGFPEPVHINRNLRYVAQDIDDWIEGLRDRGGSRPIMSGIVTTAARRRGRRRKVAPVVGQCTASSNAI